jgi:hypothetical protein
MSSPIPTSASSQISPLGEDERNQFSERTGGELLHHPIFMVRDGFRGHLQLSGYLLHRSTAAEELQYLFLPLCKNIPHGSIRQGRYLSSFVGDMDGAYRLPVCAEDWVAGYEDQDAKMRLEKLFLLASPRLQGP